MDPLIAHQRAQDAFAAVLANVGPDRLDAPTPCSEWTINDLIEHVLTGNEMVAQAAGHHQQPPARPEGLTEAHRAGADAAQQAFARPDGLDLVFDLPFGQFPARTFIAMRTTDVLTHAWDLAKATGQSTDVDPELATAQLAVARVGVPPELRGPGKFFAAEQPCPADRSPGDQLAAFLGRTLD